MRRQIWLMVGVAVFVGKRVGKTQLTPVSPNKTLEGLMGGVGCSWVRMG